LARHSRWHCLAVTVTGTLSQCSGCCQAAVPQCAVLTVHSAAAAALQLHAAAVPHHWRPRVTRSLLRIPCHDGPRWTLQMQNHHPSIMAYSMHWADGATDPRPIPRPRRHHVPLCLRCHIDARSPHLFTANFSHFESCQVTCVDVLHNAHPGAD
jgi:hypothetical protein